MSSLSLIAYKALARSTTIPQTDPYPERPDGPLIWGVVHDEHSARALIHLVERLHHLRGPCSLLMTYADKAPRVPDRKGQFCFQLPVDTGETAQRFLEHWKPSICLWFGGDLRPALIAETNVAKVHMMLLSAEEHLLDQSVWRWLPSLARETLRSFASLAARDLAAQKSLRKMNGTQRDIEIHGTLQIAVVPPAANESVFTEVSNDLNGRPVWLAANIQEDELKDVLKAHREVVKINHRLALVLVATSFPVSVEARRVLKSQGWRVCHWEDGDPIEENTQIILVEEPEDMGLWYRIAPLSFLGSSLRPHYNGCDPYVPASLGSAVIYGPNVRHHTSSYSRLAAVGAARIVKDAEGLTMAVETLLASDQSALMAHAAWVAISEGAEATDAVIESIQAQLDTLETP
jgi:3-deoxy-D-manno-octulosonic-acid transferase